MKKFNLKRLAPKYVWSKRRRFLHAKNHPFVVPITTLFILIVITGIAFIFLRSNSVDLGDSHVVILTDNGQQRTVPTRAQTVANLLERLSIKINEGDVIEPAQETSIVEDNFRVNIYRARPITIVDGAHGRLVFSAATTPRSIAAQAGIKVYPEDKVEARLPDNILRTASIGEEVVIERATPTFLNLYGSAVPIRTHATTVAGLLKEENINLAASDTVEPALSTRIKEGLSIVVSRKGTKIISATETIPFPTEIIEDNSLSFGTTAVRQQGSNGNKLVTYQIITKNGQEVGRKKIQEVIAEHPVKQIVARGKAVYIPADKSAWMSAAGIASSDYPYVNYILSRESGWCPTKLQGQYGSCPGYAPAYIPNNLGYGLGQATPGTKMSSFGSDWKTNAVTQLKWANSYAKGRYGTWSAAYNFWLSNHYW